LVVALLAVMALAVGSGVGGALNRPVLIRQGSFSVSLREHGRTVGMFRCRIRATQFQSGFTIEASPESGWLDLPTGHWRLLMAIRGRGLPPEGNFGATQRSVLGRPGRIAVVPRSKGSYEIDSGRIGPRIACGLLAVRNGQRLYQPYRRIFATVAWPSFRLLGVNVAVDAAQPQGGIG
jgi:hypothetical protein